MITFKLMLEGPLLGLLYFLGGCVGLLILCGIGGGIAFSIIEIIRLIKRRRRINEYSATSQLIV
jgi:hypothetical protein